MNNTLRPGTHVRTPSGRHARVVSLLEAGYRANLEYIPDDPPEFGEAPETVVLPVKLLKKVGA